MPIPKKNIFRKIIADAILVLLVLAAAEAACRFLPVDVPPPDDNDRYYFLNVLPHKPLFASPAQTGKMFFSATHPALGQLEFSEKKFPDTKRIFILGDSVAQQFKPKYLEKNLKRFYPNLHFEVLNCGIHGYDSLTTSIIAKQVFANYDPDAVVVLTANGEGRVPETSFFKYLLCMGRRHLALWRLLSAQMDSKTKHTPMTRSPEYFMNHFALNIRSIANTARAAKVPVILCTTPVNLHFPPSDKWPEGELFDKGRMSLLLKNPEIAKEFLTQSLAQNPGKAHTFFALGQAQNALGNYPQALELLEQAANLDFPRGRACEQANRTIRQATKNNPWCVLAKTGLVFKQQHVKDPTPAGLFYDNCHIWPVMYDQLGQEVAKAMAKRKLFGPPSTPQLPQTQQETAQNTGDTVSIRYTTPDPIPEFAFKRWILLGCFEFMHSQGYLNERALYYLSLVAAYNPELLEKIKNPDQILELLKSDPWFAKMPEADLDKIKANMHGLLIHAGFALLKDLKTDQAVDFFKQAAKLKPRDKYAHIGLAFCKNPHIPSS